MRPPRAQFDLAACSKTSGSPREGTRPTRFPRKSACIVGPVPSPGGRFNRLLEGFIAGSPREPIHQEKGVAEKVIDVVKGVAYRMRRPIRGPEDARPKLQLS